MWRSIVVPPSPWLYNYLGLDDLYKQRLQINGLHYYAEYSKENTEWGVRTELLSLDSCVSTDIRQADYYYDGKGQLTTLRYDWYDTDYTYDNLGRLIGRETDEIYGGKAVKESYEYKTYVKGNDTYTSKALVKIDDQTYYNRDRTTVYDENGYVSQIGYNGNTFSYTYDTLGRLTSETQDYETTSYTYDEYNNVQKTGLTYTNGKLTAVNGQEIEYDAMGNPTTYKGNVFIWEQGRKLTGGSMNGKSFSYAYDGNGMRYKKAVNGVTTNYYYDGTQLLMESRNAERIWYVYGATGIEGISYQHEIYYFDKNTLGDVVAIRDDLGNILATYEYDAWGNVKVMDQYGIQQTNPSFIGHINPIRYRGYYYDNETGFYYLQTRYYDPTICRFINADNYELVAQLSSVAGQLNMYAYCGNNPIMYTDETGEFLISTAVLIGAIIGGVIGATAGGIIAYNIASSNGATGWELVGWTALGVVGGGAIGAGIGAAAGYGIGYLAGGTYVNGVGVRAAKLGLRASFKTNKFSHVLKGKHLFDKVLADVTEKSVKNLAGKVLAGGSLIASNPYKLIMEYGDELLELRYVIVDGLVRIGTFFVVGG